MMSYHSDVKEMIGVTSKLELGSSSKPTRLPRTTTTVSTGTPGVAPAVRYGNRRQLAPLAMPRHARELPPRCPTPAKGHNLDDMMMCLDDSYITTWLVAANRELKQLQDWWKVDDNGVRFSHFWLSEFPDDRRRQLIEKEFDLLVGQIRNAFHRPGVMNNVGTKKVHRNQHQHKFSITNAHIDKLMRAVLREYPDHFGSGDDGTNFLDLVWVLGAKSNLEQYSALLGDVRCSSRNKIHGQWLLAIRSFALISMVTAVTSVFAKLQSEAEIQRPSTACRPSTAGRRPSTAQPVSPDAPMTSNMFRATMLGFEDVLFFMLSRGMAVPNVIDELGRTILFVAVTHRKLNVVAFILDNVQLFDINRPSQSGNTPLHAAVNNGDVEVAKLLVAAGADLAATNPLSGATPRMIAEMLNHQQLLTVLPE